MDLIPKNEETHFTKASTGPVLNLYSSDQRVKDEIATNHLEYSERHYLENQAKMDFQMLRRTQGIHAPLKLQMERKMAKEIQRLPGLQSSNMMSDLISGRLDTIDMEDVLMCPEESEVMGNPHAMMEKRLGLL